MFVIEYMQDHKYQPTREWVTAARTFETVEEARAYVVQWVCFFPKGAGIVYRIVEYGSIVGTN